MDDEVDNMLKRETKKPNEPVKKVIEYFTVQAFLYINSSLNSSIYVIFAGTNQQVWT